MERMTLFDTSFTLFLSHLPSIVTVFVGLGTSVYWFGRIPATAYSLSTKLMLERILICYIIMFTSIALFAINSFAMGADFGNYLSRDIFWLVMGLAVLGFVFTTIFVTVKCILFWSEAQSLGQRRCHCYLAFVPFWLCCFLGQMIVFILAIIKLG